MKKAASVAQIGNGGEMILFKGVLAEVGRSVLAEVLEKVFRRKLSWPDIKEDYQS